jgi:hypothetical protein
MHTSDGDQQNPLKIHLHFDSFDDVHPYDWLNAGHEALTGVVHELNAIGPVVDEQRIPASDADKARGFGLDDFLLGVATDVVATLFINLVTKIFSRHPRPGWVTVEADSTSVQINARDTADSVRSKLAAWVRQHIRPGHKVTVRLQ